MIILIFSLYLVDFTLLIVKCPYSSIIYILNYKYKNNIMTNRTKKQSLNKVACLKIEI